MKKTSILLLIVVLFVSSCEWLSQLTQFDLPYETSFNVPLIVAADSTLSIETPSISTGITDAVAQYDTGLDLIEEISLTSMTMTLSSPAGGDFGWLSSIEIFINATGQQELALAFDTSVADDAGAVLELETASDDLQNYIKLDNFTLRFVIGTDETVLDEQEITLNMVMHADAKVLGL